MSIDQGVEARRLGDALDKFTKQMRERLGTKLLEGKRGWDDPEYGDQIAQDLRADVQTVWLANGEVVEGKILVDIANRAMMLWWQHQQKET